MGVSYNAIKNNTTLHGFLKVAEDKKEIILTIPEENKDLVH